METKYNIGEEVFFMDYTTPAKEKITGIIFTVGKVKDGTIYLPEEPLIEYRFNDYCVKEESLLYTSKKALQDELFKGL